MTWRYSADVPKLVTLLAVKFGLMASAAVTRSRRARAATGMEMVSWWKWAATVFQMVWLKLWLSPKYRSLRLRLPSNSPGTGVKNPYVSCMSWLWDHEQG